MPSLQTLSTIRRLNIAAIFAGLIAINIAQATPPNTIAANAVPYEVGQGWVTHYFDEATQSRWFKYGEVGGHSYCIEAVQGSVSPIQLDPNVAVFSDATGATALSIAGTALTNNDGGGNPNFVKGSRICYISPAATFGDNATRSVKLNVPVGSGSGDAGYIKFRIVETTLVYAGNAYYANGAQALTTNHSSAPVSFKLTHVIKDYPLPQGASAAQSYDGSLVGYQSVFSTVSASPERAYKLGFLYLAHSAPPGKFSGATTGALPFQPIK